MDLLKIEFVSTSSQIRLVKEAERHHKEQMRGLNRKFPKKHELDMPAPEPSTAMLKAATWAQNQDEITVNIAIQREHDAFWGMERFRKNILRKHARNVHLARNFLSGKAYDVVEAKSNEDPNFDVIEVMVFNNLDHINHDPRDVKQRFEQWVQEGTRHPRTGKRWWTKEQQEAEKAKKG